MSFFGDIPHGKNDLPQLLAMKAPEFNIEDVDGAEYMLGSQNGRMLLFRLHKKDRQYGKCQSPVERG